MVETRRGAEDTKWKQENSRRTKSLTSTDGSEAIVIRKKLRFIIAIIMETRTTTEEGWGACDFGTIWHQRPTSPICLTTGQETLESEENVWLVESPSLGLIRLWIVQHCNAFYWIISLLSHKTSRVINCGGRTAQTKSTEETKHTDDSWPNSMHSWYTCE